jgi:thiamine pyrophosphate-dependent acetolactate synthase large subunit-like protein
MMDRMKRMRRGEAIAAVLGRLDAAAIAVAANGWISREACAAADRDLSFYMIGSMGLAAGIGLGLALAQPARRVAVLDGDGNVLMALGTLAMVAERRPANFLHAVLDNEVYGSTGAQRSLSARVPLDALAAAAGYAQVERAVDRAGLDAALDRLLATPGPSFLLIKVAPEAGGEAPRVALPPPQIADRLRRAVKEGTV